MKYTYKLLITYVGTNYHGWQLQPNGITIQEVIEKCLETLLKSSIRIIGAGRTDAGVHAKGQVAHFHYEQELDVFRMLASLNGMLPFDIRILSFEKAPEIFHAQYSALSKSYHYHLWLERIIDPFVKPYRHRPLEKIDLKLLQQAAQMFLGTKDFTTFANSPTEGSVAKNPIRTLQRIEVIEQEGGVRIEFEGDGFLYKMVRNIVGTMIEVASSYRPIDDIERLFQACDRRQAGRAVPPQGLFLMNVRYPEMFIQKY